jgi:hypothetical protein
VSQFEFFGALPFFRVADAELGREKLVSLAQVRNSVLVIGRTLSVIDQARQRVEEESVIVRIRIGRPVFLGSGHQASRFL